MIGRQDPYLKLWVGRAGTKVKTHVHEDGGKAASWEKDFVFDIKVCLRARGLHVGGCSKEATKVVSPVNDVSQGTSDFRAVLVVLLQYHV